MSICGIPAILLIISMVSTNWYVCEAGGEESSSLLPVEYKIEVASGLTGAETTVMVSAMGISMEESMKNDLDPNMETVGTITLFIIIGAFVLLAGFLVTSLLFLLGTIRKIAPVILGFATVLVIALALIYFPLAFPDAMEQDFEDEMGSSSDLDAFEELIAGNMMDDLIDSGHVGWTYFLVVGAAVLMLIPPVLILIPGNGKKSPDVYFEEDKDEDDVWA